MRDTKEKILTTALGLFAKEGYEAVSVSDIAGAIGMTKGALYKHYKNKRAIFDSIVERMYVLDAQRSEAFALPKEQYEKAAAPYSTVSMESVRHFTLAQFTFWTEDTFATAFRKMLMLEQYRNAEMAELYRNCITFGPVAYMRDIFREMQKRGILKGGDPEELAVSFYAPLYLLIQLTETEADKQKNLALLDAHIHNFNLQNMISEGEKT